MTAAINPGPVFAAGTAKSITAAQTTLPSMRGTILGWFKPMKVGVVTTDIADEGPEDGQAEEVVRWVETSGLFQPGGPEKLSFASEGERSWENATLHVFPQLDVPTKSVLLVNGQRFQVMARWDFSINGYIRYDMVQMPA